MAVDVCSKTFVGMTSPRFSFSNDRKENRRANPVTDYPCRLDHNLIDSAFDFAFNVDSSTAFQSSTADELFSNGKILPTCVNNEGMIRKVKPTSLPCSDLQSTTPIEPKKKSLKEFLEDNSEEEEPNMMSAKPFWKFRRSNSLNCDRNQRKKLFGSLKELSRSGSTGKFLEKILEEEEKPNTNISLFRNFIGSNSLSSVNVNSDVVSNKGMDQSLKMLRRSNSTSDQQVANPGSKPFRRSNSTGSAPDHVRNKKHHQSLRHHQHDQQILGNAKTAQKGHVKNNKEHSFGKYYNNNVKTSPALNLPSPYISRVSLNLFGFGSLFCNGTKERKKKN